MSKYITEVSIEIKGNADQKLVGLTRSFTRFNRDANRSLRGIGSGVAGFSRQLDRFGGQYAAFLGGIAGGALLKKVGDVEHKLLEMRLAAGESASSMMQSSNTMYDAARKYGVATDEIATGVQSIIAKTGDYKLAVSMIDLLGKGVGGGFSTGEDVAAIISNLSQKLGINTVEDMTEAINILAQQADAGAVEFKDLATQAEILMTAYATTGKKGIAAVREMGADIQTVKQGTTTERLGAAVSAMYRQLFAKQKELKKMGVSIYDPKELAKGNYVMRDTYQIMQEIKKATKGEIGATQLIFGDEGKAGALMMYNMSEQTYENLKKGANAAGQIGKSLDFKASEQRKSFNGAVQSLSSAFEKLAVNKLTPAIQALANAINGLADSPDIVNKLVGGGAGLGALYLGNKGVRGAIGGGKELAKWVAPEARVAGGLASAAKGMGGVGRFAAGARGAAGLMGKLFWPLQALLGAVDIGGAMMSGDRDQVYGSVGRTIGNAGGGWGGAALGAGIGSMVMPGLGTVLGAGIGGIAGGMGLGSLLGGVGENISKSMTAADIETAMVKANNATSKKDMMEVGIRLELAGTNVGGSLSVIDFLSQGDSTMKLGKVAVR